MNDQEAIVLLKSDSHEAFEYLYKVYGGQVYNFSKLYINSSEDIKEVVQEVFVKLWEARSFLREDENFRGFLFIVTRNLIFNRQKKTFNENFYKLSVNPEKPDVPLNKNDAFQKVQKRRVQEKR